MIRWLPYCIGLPIGLVLAPLGCFGLAFDGVSVQGVVFVVAGVALLGMAGGALCTAVRRR